MPYILVLALTLFLATPVMAQSIGDLYQLVLQSGGEYRQSHSEYQLARNQHVQYNTAATRIAAIDKTKRVLTTRNQLHSDYLTYLRAYLAETTNIANYAQTIAYLDLETEINTLAGYPNTFASLNTFEAINASSIEWEERLEVITDLIDASRLQIASTKLANLHARLTTHMTDYTSIHTESSPTLDLITQKLQNADALRTTADRELAAYKANSFSKSNSITKLRQSQQLLLEAARLLDELTR